MGTAAGYARVPCSGHEADWPVAVEARIADDVIVERVGVSNVFIRAECSALKAGGWGMIVTHFIVLVADVLGAVTRSACDGAWEVLTELMAEDAFDTKGWRGEWNVRRRGIRWSAVKV